MSIFEGLAVLATAAAIGGVIARLFKQPLLLGYAISGIILSALGFTRLANVHELLGFSGQLGVTLLLFLVGLELPISELKQVGKTAMFSGIAQVLFTFGLGTWISGSAYIGLGLAFSSTIVVVKLLTERKDLASLYGKLTVGILLVQDFVAIGAMIFLAGSGNFVLTGIKGIVLVSIFSFVVVRIMPKVTAWLGQSTELLFVGTLAWCLAVAALVSSPLIGFTAEIGGFLAGLALAGSSEHLQISARIRPLRDFFLTLFFISLGAGVSIAQISSNWLIAVLLSVFVLTLKPIVVISILLFQGYGARVAYMTGLALSQVSEFSLLLAALAIRTNQADSSILTVVSMVGIITMISSNYLSQGANKIYSLVAPFLTWMEHKKNHSLSKTPVPSGHIVMFGHNRIGNIIRPVLETLKKPLLIVDFDPEVTEKLKLISGVQSVFGDMSDEGLYESLGLTHAELVVSTVSDCDDNLLLLSFIGKSKNPPISIIVAGDTNDAQKLYSAGADLVIIPHSMGGEYLATLFENRGLNKDYIVRRGKLHAKNL
ncbi:cation:proton antiporter [Candidatus Amesbacteria bacterium]|nr:cation:proton antiporter [Candidatus Amesbacteria bacterium]